MVYENKNYKIYYHECDQRYIEKILDILKERVPRILSFFQLDSQDQIMIKLYDQLDEYQSNINASFQKAYESGECETLRTFQDWMIANTEDGNINLQSLDLVKQIPLFQDYTEQEFCYNVAHEFTHICQQKVGSNSPGWFWEVLATNLGNPECQQETKETFTLDDLNHRFDEIDGYGAVYKLGKYLFQNYDDAFILELVKDQNQLEKVIEEVCKQLNRK